MILNILLWLHGALVGATVMIFWIWWVLATGRRTVAPWPWGKR